MGERRRLPAVCNELCYTLSVVAALAAFLKTDHQRALLLEDDHPDRARAHFEKLARSSAGDLSRAALWNLGWADYRAGRTRVVAAHRGGRADARAASPVLTRARSAA